MTRNGKRYLGLLALSNRDKHIYFSKDKFKEKGKYESSSLYQNKIDWVSINKTKKWIYSISETNRKFMNLSINIYEDYLDKEMTKTLLSDIHIKVIMKIIKLIFILI